MERGDCEVRAPFDEVVDVVELGRVRSECWQKERVTSVKAASLGPGMFESGWK